ncbi:DNA mismatch endonuclease Vsr [Botrimarina mediterranea]|uniref:Very short patch repair protein n=1 Tax=Botrimarina mediterranea TaxID=2528022 RepID=A0A518KAP9_9BACT|nr:DNA mismatch endonuclease Vsr [Botrimarina mediterranea]QDV74873.1 Very short patch repair protein [Botrimarina mediterranea]QDV79516.1 Very short patch repair protein [Planctomycetes bacterium K2D]
MPTARIAKPSAERSRTMRAVKSRDTKPELLVAALLDELGVAYRREVAALPGKPDFVITGRGRVVEKRGRQPLALFVHGCWWHAHDCPRGARTPKTNRAYWTAKITRNRRRDRRVTRELRELGYSVWTIWECRLKSRRLPPRLTARLKDYVVSRRR